MACEDGEAVAHECDGAGDCRATPPEPCSPYVCGGTACLTECESDHDCDHGFACDDGDRECIPASAECVDGIWVVAADGTRQDCTPFACDGASGTCFAACTSVDECAPDHRCDADGNCIPTEDAEPEDAGPWDAEPEEDDSACGCRAGGASSRAGLQGLAMLLALGWLGLRRRQRGASS